jgi:hypothetical protein
MGRRIKDGNHSPQKKNNNSMQDSVGNEENGYPALLTSQNNDKCH